MWLIAEIPSLFLGMVLLFHMLSIIKRQNVIAGFLWTVPVGLAWEEYEDEKSTETIFVSEL